MNALNITDTWNVVDLSREKKKAEWKWVFTIKWKANENLDRYKTRLVSKGFTGIYDTLAFLNGDLKKISLLAYHMSLKRELTNIKHVD